ncbi:MAG: hypothetical protein SVP52_01920 [Chloroflexota bacterium]|nr:hypothetical protein [Chloroflexota bacterium]
MKKYLRLSIFLLLASSLSGCSQWEVTQSMELTRLTPEIDPLIVDQQADLLKSLDPNTKQFLEVYPLLVGNSWDYKYLGFDERTEVFWHVTERVEESRFVNGYYLAKIERTTMCYEGNPPDDFQNAPPTGTFWYLVDGNKLYFFEDDYDTYLSDAWLELVIPFPEEEGWYPHPELRAMQAPGLMGYRQASKPYQKVLPIGGTYTCYNISTNVEDAKTRQTFCENIGVLYKEYIDFDQDFGYRVEMVGFSIQ